MAQATENLMNLKAASQYLGCSTVTAKRMAKRGDLPVVKLPGTRLVRFRPAALRQVIETLESGAISERGSAA